MLKIEINKNGSHHAMIEAEGNAYDLLNELLSIIRAIHGRMALHSPMIATIFRARLMSVLESDKFWKEKHCNKEGYSISVIKDK